MRVVTVINIFVYLRDKIIHLNLAKSTINDNPEYFYKYILIETRQHI